MPRLAYLAQPVIVNGTAGFVVGTREDPFAVIGFTVVDGQIAAIDLLADREKIGQGQRI